MYCLWQHLDNVRIASLPMGWPRSGIPMKGATTLQRFVAGIKRLSGAKQFGFARSISKRGKELPILDQHVLRDHFIREKVEQFAHADLILLETAGQLARA